MRWLLPVVCVACARPHVEAPRLAPGASIEKQIAAGEVHHYDVEVPADSVLFIELDQLGADVRATAYGPDGVRLATFDSSSGPKGTEHVRVDAKRTGTYRIDVTTVAGTTGAYRTRVVEVVSQREIAARDQRQRAAIEQFFTERRELVDAIVAWAKQAAIGDDLAGIERVIGEARVIGLGEADHGIHEYLAFRNRLAKYLVEHGIVTAILVESGFTEATAVDDYVTGASKATARDVAPAFFMWGMPAAMQDNVELLEWLHAHNAKAARKVHVYGFDVTGGRDGLYQESRLAVDAALAYLADVDRAAHDRLAARLTPLLPKFTTAGYLELTPAERDELRSAVGDLLAAFKPLRGGGELRRARQHAAMAAVVETFLRQTVARSSKQDLADVGLDGIRDATMAANVMWALDEEGAGSRVFLFTHNAHLRRAPVVAWPAKLPPITSLGQYLSNSLKGRFVAIGALHGDGLPTATLDGLFAKVGLASFVVDLRSAPDAVRIGLGQSWDFRLDGFRALGLKPAWTAIPLKSYDALYFTSTVSDAALAK